MNGNMPRVGETVYVIYGDEIYEEKVFAVGEKHFILESFRNTVELYWLQRLEDKDSVWFFDLEKAKDELMSRYNDEYELVEYTKRWYGVRRL